MNWFSWFSEAARRANLEKPIHENNMLQEGNEMIRYREAEGQKNGLPTQC
jgi:hypothetical protein